MKKIFLIIFLLLFLTPSLVQAQGLVPCGRSTDDPNTSYDETKPCQLCHIFVLFDNILKFIFFKIVPPLAILMIAIGGLYFLFSSGNPSTLAQGKAILKYTAIGLLIIYGAWVVVNLILTFPGLMKTDFGGWNPETWFQADWCQIR